MNTVKGRISSLETMRTFFRVGTCSQTLFQVLDRADGQEMELEEHASDPLAGGMMCGYQCGMLWGAALAAGARAYRACGKGPQAETRAVLDARRVLETFRARNKHINCRDITGIDLASPQSGNILWYLVKSIPTGSCFGMAARYAGAAFRALEAPHPAEPAETPSSGPVSCAALLAQKLGASDQHTVMAAGLAGGIGLSGGACGALGAAIWLAGMNPHDEAAPPVGLKPAYVVDALDRFSRCTGGVFECSKIAGMQFKSVGDHAAYLRAGGCAKVISVLAGA